MAQLEVISGKSAGKIHELEEGERIEVGTSRRAALRILDKGISYTHAALEGEGGVWTLIDLRSREGTFVNGERLEPDASRLLQTGDTLAFGTTEARFTCEAPRPERSASGRIEALREGTEAIAREEDLRDELARAQEVLAETSAALQEAEAELQEAQARIAQLEQDVVAAKQEGESNMESVFATLEAFETKIREYEARIPELEAQLAEARAAAQA